MSFTIRPRAGTVAEWNTANPVLAEREIGFELQPQDGRVQLKMGDGKTAWRDLPYAIPNPVGKYEDLSDTLNVDEEGLEKVPTVGAVKDGIAEALDGTITTYTLSKLSEITSVDFSSATVSMIYSAMPTNTRVVAKLSELSADVVPHQYGMIIIEKLSSVNGSIQLIGKTPTDGDYRMYFNINGDPEDIWYPDNGVNFRNLTTNNGLYSSDILSEMKVGSMLCIPYGTSTKAVDWISLYGVARLTRSTLNRAIVEIFGTDGSYYYKMINNSDITAIDTTSYRKATTTTVASPTE